MNITLDEIQGNLKNNKIYLEQDTIKINNIIYENNNSIFNDILLKNLFNYKIKSIILKTSTTEIDYNQETNKDNNNNKEQLQLKYKKNTFINELINCLHERALLDNPCIREFKEIFLDFVNNRETKEYLKTFTRSYKKFQFKINEILNIDNIDEALNYFSELIKVICKCFNIRILIICNDFYKLYENDNQGKICLTFDKVSVKYKEGHKKIYKFNEECDDISNILKDKYRYYDEKEINKLKLEELKLIGKDFKIYDNKKADIIKKILNICSNFD